MGEYRVWNADSMLWRSRPVNIKCVRPSFRSYKLLLCQRNQIVAGIALKKMGGLYIQQHYNVKNAEGWLL